LDKSNIIISIIIVLCIAAAVTAYGITNSDNPIFSNLSSMGANDAGNGLGNNTTLSNHSSSVATTTGSSSSGDGSGSSDYSDSGSSDSSSSSSSSDSGSSSNSDDNGGSNDDNGGSNTQMSYSDAKAIAADAILEDGCYAGDGYYSDGLWFFTIYDKDGNAVDTISVDDKTGATGRG
jgi:hypothetical protein